jgi:hypothetical protein
VRIVSNYNVTISPQEYEQICEIYRNGPADPRVRWMDFCEDVDRVWTIKELEKDPLLRVAPYREEQTLPARKDPIPLTAE